MSSYTLWDKETRGAGWQADRWCADNAVSLEQCTKPLRAVQEIHLAEMWAGLWGGPDRMGIGKRQWFGAEGAPVIMSVHTLLTVTWHYRSSMGMGTCYQSFWVDAHSCAPRRTTEQADSHTLHKWWCSWDWGKDPELLPNCLDLGNHLIFAVFSPSFTLNVSPKLTPPNKTGPIETIK